ncbi:MAG: hypothetical protein F6K00_16990 [Leptolyngbya sp. SIOISBB]|nr:hypothetical protein [Leptolyngbya sp. SIOISBB]
MNSFKFLLLGIAIASGITLTTTSPSAAQIIDLGGFRIDLDEDESQLRPRISTDGDRLNLEIIEQPEPETQIRLDGQGLTIERVQEPAREVLDFSVPLN